MRQNTALQKPTLTYPREQLKSVLERSSEKQNFSNVESGRYQTPKGVWYLHFANMSEAI